jgi:hypothetical protein
MAHGAYIGVLERLKHVRQQPRLPTRASAAQRTRRAGGGLLRACCPCECLPEPVMRVNGSLLPLRRRVTNHTQHKAQPLPVQTSLNDLQRLCSGGSARNVQRSRTRRMPHTAPGRVVPPATWRPCKSMTLPCNRGRIRKGGTNTRPLHSQTLSPAFL